MVRSLRSSRAGRFASRGALCVAILLAVGLVTRLAAAWPVAMTAVTTVVAVGSMIAGFVINGRGHGAQWRKAWVLLGLALTLLTIS
ncbi:MAG TPA: hypothetical protein VL119_14335, partial [Acidimicrobiia bacterium]|nr:hypothetical protein [Acidimicrobiia bacterium]